MSELDRVRWRCRRGLMELEIILERFLHAHYTKLSAAEQAAFNELLTYQDADLWSLVSGETSELSLPLQGEGQDGDGVNEENSPIPTPTLPLKGRELTATTHSNHIIALLRQC